MDTSMDDHVLSRVSCDNSGIVPFSACAVADLPELYCIMRSGQNNLGLDVQSHLTALVERQNSTGTGQTVSCE